MLILRHRGAGHLRFLHPPSAFVQRRFARAYDIRFLATHKRHDRVTDKYQEKLQRKAQTLGLSNVDELKAAHKRDSSILPLESSASATIRNRSLPFPSPPPPPQSLQTPNAHANERPPPGIKHLSSFIDIGKTLELPEREIEYIWRLRHARDPQSLCAVIPKSTYEHIARTARSHPQFILPLPREGQGAEIHFLQWTFPTPTTAAVLFTHLAEFKLRGEFAQPHTVVTHHLDLADTKGLILLQGNVMEGRGVSVDEARWLLMCLQKFYGGTEEGTEREKLLRQFTEGDGGFKVEELLEESEKIV